jgi:hypothetical protein
LPTPSTPYRRQRPVQQTSAEFTKEMLTPSGHYKVEFTGSVCGPLRVISAVGRGRSSRARQTAVVVLDVMLYCGPAITPDKKVAFLLGCCSAYDGWLITSPYVTRLTMVNTKSWF